MATYKSKAVQSYRPAINSCQAGEVRTVRGEIDLAADVGGALALNDILEMVKLPAEHVPVDCVIDSDDLDSNGTPLISLTGGLTAGTVAELVAANTVARAGGVARMDAVAGVRLAATAADRVVGLKVTAAPATGAVTGKVGFTLSYRAAGYDD